MAFTQFYKCSGQVNGFTREWVFAAFVFVSICISAQAVPPTWLNQIKLSGISGFPEHSLAVINGKTLSPGEDCDLKLKGHTVHLQCLEIHEQSTLVKIQGVLSPCELTFSGILLPEENSPAAALTQPSSSHADPAIPTSTTPLNLFISSQTPSIRSSSESQICGVGLFLGSIAVALLVGISIGIGATGAIRKQQHQNMGEAMVAETINNHFSRQHLLLNNITLPTAGGTTQIDHILVADTGIFVIETKHYKGWIFGEPMQSQWTQVIYRHKSRFPNPFRQNYGHVKTLQELLNLPEDHFHSVVVFTGDAKFKSDLGSNVLRLTSLISFLSAERPVVFDERKMAYVIGRIEISRKRRSLETDEYHINHVRSRLAGKT